MRVADTTIASATGATFSVIVTGPPAPQSVVTVSNPVSEARIRQPSGAFAMRNVPSVSVKIDPDVDPLAGRCDFEFEILSRLLRVGREKDLCHVAIPQMHRFLLELRVVADDELFVLIRVEANIESRRRPE